MQMRLDIACEEKEMTGLAGSSVSVRQFSLTVGVNHFFFDTEGRTWGMTQ